MNKGFRFTLCTVFLFLIDGQRKGNNKNECVRLVIILITSQDSGRRLKNLPLCRIFGCYYSCMWLSTKLDSQ